MNETTQAAQAQTQPTPKPTVKRRAPRLTRREKDSIMRDLGLTKVRGAVSGRIYYE